MSFFSYEEDDDDEVFLPAVEEAADERHELVVQAEPGGTGPNLKDRGSSRRPTRYETNVAGVSLPETFEEAMKSQESSEWIEAIRRKLNAHKENGT